MIITDICARLAAVEKVFFMWGFLRFAVKKINPHSGGPQLIVVGGGEGRQEKSSLIDTFWCYAWDRYAAVSPSSSTQASTRRLKRKSQLESWLLVFGNGAQGRNRTTDTGIFSPLLYRLSYLGNGALLNPFQRLESILTEDYFCGGT